MGSFTPRSFPSLRPRAPSRPVCGRGQRRHGSGSRGGGGHGWLWYVVAGRVGVLPSFPFGVEGKRAGVSRRSCHSLFLLVLG